MQLLNQSIYGEQDIHRVHWYHPPNIPHIPMVWKGAYIHPHQEKRGPTRTIMRKDTTLHLDPTFSATTWPSIFIELPLHHPHHQQTPSVVDLSSTQLNSSKNYEFGYLWSATIHTPSPTVSGIQEDTCISFRDYTHMFMATGITCISCQNHTTYGGNTHFLT